MASVEITQSGRGGRIIYREGDHEIGFDWEFAMEPALAQETIYDFVGREVIRQKASDRTFDRDLESGEMTILAPRR